MSIFRLFITVVLPVVFLGALWGRGSSDGVQVTPLEGTSKNPIISHIYTADPTGRVFNGRVYIYASHDEDNQQAYNMKDYHVFSSSDLVNWQDHGVVFSVDDAPWATSLYAPDCVERNGLYYLYFPNTGQSIGVAVSESPYGPFKDALGHALIDSRTSGGEDVEWVFDPAVFIDDDGQAYLYYGGGMPGKDNARVIKLNEDMISTDGEAVPIKAPYFFEASFMHKHKGHYYFSYSTNWLNGRGIYIDYLMGDDPIEGLEYSGTVMGNPPYNNGNNNHHSIFQFRNRWYILYHSRKLSAERGAGSFERSITIDYLDYDEDGKIRRVKNTDGSVKQLGTIDPYTSQEAELMAAESGVEVETVLLSEKERAAALTDLNAGDWTGVSKVDFGPEGASVFKASLTASRRGSFDVWIDGGPGDEKGRLLGTLEYHKTRGRKAWEEFDCSIDKVQGVHDLYFIFKGNGRDRLLFDSYLFE